ncbi:bactofilin family protein [Kordiimonas aquimaris]|uniref:bactofilin family protein n=1 Tax=Kordiimonas aquimaris TaxID=707591 RepID=UPI0021D14347|nr:polymer-forming cytoskeletal protein [Kordiimonas aquimaris]
MKKPANNQTNSPRPGVAATPSIIGADVQIEGNIKTIGELQLDGAITGDLVCGGLVMGESGSVNGTIAAETVTIRGNVSGQIKAKSVRLEKSAVVEGDVYHESLSVEAGARLTGRFAHTSGSNQQATATPIKNETAETPSFVEAKKAAAE